MIHWTKTAFVFPGQGSQLVGMGADFAAAYPVARQVFEQADSLMGWAFSRVMFDGPEDRLNDTAMTQPALYVSSIAMLRALQQELPDAHPAFYAGHSLGEFTALTAAGALAFEDGLRLVIRRAELMRDAGQHSPGAMAAVLGLDAAAVRDICQQASAQTGGALVLANDNCPGQVVISGDMTTLDVSIPLLTAAGAKRAVKLAVSVAAHSPLMASAASAFVKAVQETPFTTPQVPVIANVSAKPLESVMDIRLELQDQLTQAVRWTESIEHMVAEGCALFVEIGAGDVLSGLIKRINRTASRATVNSVDALHKLVTQARLPSDED